MLSIRLEPELEERLNSLAKELLAARATMLARPSGNIWKTVRTT